MSTILAVALGGAIGAVGRFAVVSGIGRLLGVGWPWGTLTVNVAGSIIMGIVIELSALAWSPSPQLRAFIVVGVLGAFTTFSSFSLEVVGLLERGQPVPAALYVAASVVICVAGVYLGMRGMRLVLA
ncbi:MAG: fluoride efflux transporter CrcB [Roseitalea porphyridii]